MKDEIQKSEKSEQIKQLKKTLKQCLETVNWTPKELAEKMADKEIRENSSLEYMSEDEIEKFTPKLYNKLRKHMERETTKPETLREYIDFIISHKAYKDKENVLRLPKLDLSLLKLENSDQEILEEISKISDEVFSENKK